MLDAATFFALPSQQQDAATAYDRCQVPSGSRLSWCVVATLPKAERRAHAALHRFGFEAYLPLVTVRWRDRTWHTRAAFPGYCFVRLDLSRPWSPVKHAPGVFSLLSTDGFPSICPDHAVEAVRKAVDAADAFAAGSQPWKPGAPCSMALGPLEGLPAIITAVRQHRAVIAVLLFGQLREINVRLADLIPHANES